MAMYYNGYYPPQGQLEQYKQPYMGNQMPQPYQQPQQSVDDRIWVNGEAQAMDYLIAPNGFVRLWDSQSNCFYEKRADASGRPYIEAFDYTRRGGNQNNSSQQATIDYSAKIKALEGRLRVLEKELGYEPDESNADD